jgi:ubiquinol-cytochrome c reductase iron-sulfur subunit
MREERNVSDAAIEQSVEPADEDRRNFILIATGMTALGGGGALAWPLIRQMSPAADTRAASSLDVDVSKVPEGGEIRVLIAGTPFFIRHRTKAEIAAARGATVATLPDPQSDEARLVAKPDGTIDPAVLVTSGVCTHLGCVPVGPNQGNTGDYGGWYCPCHGSHYDTSGRIRKGPAPTNLPIPAYSWLSDSTINISL